MLSFNFTAYIWSSKKLKNTLDQNYTVMLPKPNVTLDQMLLDQMLLDEKLLDEMLLDEMLLT